MRPNTSPSLISAAPRVAPSKQSISSTGKPRLRRGDGRGIATASNAGGRHAASMGRGRKTYAMPVFATGGSKIRSPQQASISAATSNRNMASRLNRSRICGKRRVVDVRSARGRPLASLWITATQRVTFDPYSARRAIPFSAGTRRRPTASFAFSAMLRNTGDRAPCHADALLELANQ